MTFQRYDSLLEMESSVVHVPGTVFIGIALFFAYFGNVVNKNEE